MHKKNLKYRKSLPSILALLLLLLAACSSEPDEPGWDYFPDMYYSKAYETYSDNPVFEDGKTMQSPVEGTIPRDMIPFQYEKTEEDRILAGKELVNPYTDGLEHVARGKDAYNAFCIQCHGENGEGEGLLYTSGKYGYKPASLVNEKMINAPDGELYHAITVGYGIMGAHGPLVRPDDRWKIILYIRESLQK